MTLAIFVALMRDCFVVQLLVVVAEITPITVLVTEQECGRVVVSGFEGFEALIPICVSISAAYSNFFVRPTVFVGSLTAFFCESKA